MFVLGLLTPLASIVVVILKDHYWLTKGGYEYCLATLVVAIAVALTGVRQYSLDAILF